MSHPDHTVLPHAAQDAADACIRDMMGLVSLPALWTGRRGPDILQIMSEAVGRVVPFDFLFVQAVLQTGDAPHRLLKLRRGEAQPAPPDAWRDAAEAWSQAGVPDGRPFEGESPLGQLRVVGVSLGAGTHGGKAWFGAADPAFPSYHQLALLRVATSLAAAGLQAARIHEERDQASRAKDEFLAMLAHELRNPLAPITTAAELLALTAPDNERVRKSSSVIARQAGHMSALIDDLLDVSRVTRGLIVLDRRDADLINVLAEAVEQARPLIEARRHDLALAIPAGPVRVDGDHKRLVQIVSNVLNNAAKYTPPGGHIALALEVRPDAAVVTIADDGVGMTADLIRRAFDLFTQAQRTPDRSQGGLGLGLALVKSLVELHGGTVGAHSDGPGRGSTFTIRLPRAAAPA